MRYFLRNIVLSLVLLAGAKLSSLNAVHTNIVSDSGNAGHLIGTNLGGWFIMENYMTPIDSGRYYATDQYTMMMELSNRFCVTTERSLIKTYQTHFITTADLDNVHNSGINAVRIPI